MLGSSGMHVGKFGNACWEVRECMLGSSGMHVGKFGNACWEVNLETRIKPRFIETENKIKQE
jgi:hypothetical protein